MSCETDVSADRPTRDRGAAAFRPLCTIPRKKKPSRTFRLIWIKVADAGLSYPNKAPDLLLGPVIVEYAKG
jgi:hypothetical protein